jgi:hypothetical protein
MWADFRNSILRYFKNNFSDGFKQDAYDVLLGNATLETRLPDFDQKLPQQLLIVSVNRLITGPWNIRILLIGYPCFIYDSYFFFILLSWPWNTHVSFSIYCKMDIGQWKDICQLSVI